MLTPLLAAILATQAVTPVAEQAQTRSAQDAPADTQSAAITAGKSEEAIAALEHARAKHSNDPALLINLGVAYAHRGDDDRARNLFKAAMQSRTEIELETADGAVNSRRLARKALSMLERGELRMTKVSAQR